MGPKLDVLIAVIWEGMLEWKLSGGTEKALFISADATLMQ